MRTVKIAAASALMAAALYGCSKGQEAPAQGAPPVTCVEDILEVIAPQLLTSQTQFALGSNTHELQIIAQLQAGLRDGDEIQRATGIAAGDMSTSLTMLELAGTIKALGANQWTLR